MAAQTLDRLMQGVFDDEQADQAVVDEGRTMLSGYVAGLPEAASPPPSRSGRTRPGG